MKAYVDHWLDVLRTSFWFVPAMFGCAAIALAVVLVWVDSSVSTCDSELLAWLCAVDSEGARQLLVMIGGSMITVAGVVFSITIVALSMASAQFGPKLLRNYMRDRANQIVLGAFIADFVYCLMVLRYVRSGGGDPFVPYLAVNFSTLLALASLALLIYFFHHISSSIQADNVVAMIGRELIDGIDGWIADNEEYTAPGTEEARDWARVVEDRGSGLVASPASGYIQSVDYAGLLTVAERHDICLRIQLRAGRFVIEGGRLLDYTPASDEHEEIEAAARNAFILGSQRSPVQDIEYVIDQIDQVAARALSPSLNDPYTAMVCADWLSSGIARLATRDFPSPHRYDSDGRLRMIIDTLTFAGIVNTAFDEFRQDARPNAAVTIRLLECIARIAAQTENRAHLLVLKRQADMIERSSHDGLPEASDRNDVADRHRALLRLLATKTGATHEMISDTQTGGTRYGD